VCVCVCVCVCVSVVVSKHVVVLLCLCVLVVNECVSNDIQQRGRTQLLLNQKEKTQQNHW